MDSARQAIRYALPGLLFAFFWLVFLTINWSISKLFEGPEKEFLFATITFMNQLVLPLTLASIPFGFVIYQIYYFVYWKARIPRFLKSIIDSTDRGRYILKDVETVQQFKQDFPNRLRTPPNSAYVGNEFWRDGKVMEDYSLNWNLSESVWYLVLKQKENVPIIDQLEKRNQMLADIYHTLGVAYFSLILSFLFYLAIIIYVLIWKDQGIWYFSIGGIIVNAIVLRLIFLTLRAGRMNSFEALTTLKRDLINFHYQIIPNNNQPS